MAKDIEAREKAPTDVCVEPGCGREANSERPAYCIRHLKSDYEAQRMAGLQTKLCEAQELGRQAWVCHGRAVRERDAAIERAEAAIRRRATLWRLYRNTLDRVRRLKAKAEEEAPE